MPIGYLFSVISVRLYYLLYVVVVSLQHIDL